MPKGRSPKLKGSICNDGADSNGLVIVKLKRKLNYQGHVYFQAVRPETVFHA